MKFAIPDNFPVVYSDDHAALGPLRERGDLALHSSRHESPEELVERMRGAVSVKTPTLASARSTRYKPSERTPASAARSSTVRGPADSRSARSSRVATWSAAAGTKPSAS